MIYVSFFTQVQGLIEHFRDSCGGVITWLDTYTRYTAFSEGWALYAENPLIARDTNVYEKEPLQKYGMLKWQVCAGKKFELSIFVIAVVFGFVFVSVFWLFSSLTL